MNYPCYLYDMVDLRSEIEELMLDDKHYRVELDGVVYGRQFRSDMTGMNVFVISDVKSDVEDITIDEFSDWLNTIAQDYPEYMYGLPVVDDESGAVDHMKSAVLFDRPVSEILQDIDDPSNILDYATTIINDVYYVVDWSFEYSSILIDVVKSSHFRF